MIISSVVIPDEELSLWWESIHNPYERLEAVGKVLLRDNPDATIYDMFNFIRERLFNGVKYNENSDFIRNIDFEIEYGTKQY